MRCYKVPVTLHCLGLFTVSWATVCSEVQIPSANDRKDQQAPPTPCELDLFSLVVTGRRKEPPISAFFSSFPSLLSSHVSNPPSFPQVPSIKLSSLSTPPPLLSLPPSPFHSCVTPLTYTPSWKGTVS